MGLIPLKAWLYGGLVIALLAGLWWFVAHERNIGKAEIIQADKNAKALLDAQVKADEQILQAAAEKAATERKGVQKTLDDYMAAHPTGPVRLCVQNRSSAGLSKAPGTGSSAANSGPGPTAVPEVSGRDIASGLDAIVRAATELDTLYQERQKLGDHQ